MTLLVEPVGCSSPVWPKSSARVGILVPWGFMDGAVNITSAIANESVLHGVDDFEIKTGNTLSNPAFVEEDELKTFDVVLANPPYSIKVEP